MPTLEALALTANRADSQASDLGGAAARPWMANTLCRWPSVAQERGKHGVGEYWS